MNQSSVPVDNRAASLQADSPRVPSGPKVLHLGKYYYPSLGGIETHIRVLTIGLARRHCQVEVFCVNDGPNNSKQGRFPLAGITQDERFHDHEVAVTKVGRVANLLRFDICPQLRQKLGKAIADCELIHLHVPNPTMLMALAAINPTQPIVVTWHSDVVKFNQRMAAKLLQPLENRVLNKAAQIIVSNPQYPLGSSQLRRHANKLSVVPFGIPLQHLLHPSSEVQRKIAELRQRWPEPVWLAVGRMVYYKGMHVAIKALQHVPGTLLIVGSGPLRVKLQRLAQKLKVSDRIEWLGAVDEHTLTALYHVAKALWFPSIARSESFGLVQVEAMAAGCPVINCDIANSGVPWVSTHHVSGITVPIEAPEKFAQAAQSLLQSPHLRDTLSAGARQRAQDHFELDSMIDQTLDCYKKALA